MAIIWTALIFFVCFIPGNEIPKVKVPLNDKQVHFIIFAVFSFLWLAVFKKTHLAQYFFVLVLSFATGVFVELIQGSGITYGRSFEVNDIIADTIGGAMGLLVFYICNFVWKI